MSKQCQYSTMVCTHAIKHRCKVNIEILVKTFTQKIPSTALDEKNAILFDSNGFSLVYSDEQGSASDSPVKELLST